MFAIQGDFKKMTQNEIDIKNSSDKNIDIKHAYTNKQNWFLSITKQSCDFIVSC